MSRLFFSSTKEDVFDKDSPWFADPTITKVERRVFVAPTQDEFRSEGLNDIVCQFEMIFRT